MYSLIIKVFCVVFALYCIGWYVKTYEPELYQQFSTLLTGGVSAPATVETKQETMPPVTQTHTESTLPLPLPTMSWIFTEAMPDESLSMPRTTVALRVGCPLGVRACEESVIQAGTFPGLCTVIEQPESQNELTGVLCWFAGGGDEVGVFEEGQHLILKKGQLGEPTAETNAFRGNFVDIAVIR